MLFVTARNLLYDYLRRYCRHRDVIDCLYYTAECADNDTESRVVADDLAGQEKKVASPSATTACRLFHESVQWNDGFRDSTGASTVFPYCGEPLAHRAERDTRIYEAMYLRV